MTLVVLPSSNIDNALLSGFMCILDEAGQVRIGLSEEVTIMSAKGITRPNLGVYNSSRVLLTIIKISTYNK